MAIAMTPSQSIFTDSLQSKVISFLRFPLIVGVVMIHSDPGAVNIGGTQIFDIDNFKIYEYTRYFVSEILARIAVPLFFFISGFLFFKGSFSFNSYLLKIKRRTKTIVVPYIIWNLFVIALVFLQQTFMSGLSSCRNGLLIDNTLVEWISAFWNYNNTSMPICYQFWFIRDLIVTIILSPILYLGIKYLRYYFVLFLGILWLLNIWFNIVGFSIVAFFFFSAGAYFNIFRINFIKTFQPFMKWAIIAYIVLSVTNLYFNHDTWVVYVHRIGILAGIISVITVSAHYIKLGKWEINNFLSESSFFIYAYHATFLALITKASVKYIIPTSNFELIILYFLSSAITILIGLGLYYILKLYLPKFTRIITGDR